MSDCECGNCMCGKGIQINTPEDNQYESSGFNTYEWKMPVIFPNTDGEINKNG